MVLVAVAFLIGAVVGAVITAALVARGQRDLALGPADLELPVRPAEQWLAERAEPDPLASIADQRVERFHEELARRVGRDAATTARERRDALTRALRPSFGITMRVRE